MAKYLANSDDIIIEEVVGTDSINFNTKYSMDDLKDAIDTNTLDIENICENQESSSITKPYSCDYINDRNTFSSNEEFTGKYWEDSKKIYRKVITLTDHPGQVSPFTKALGLSNIDQIWLDTTHSQWISTTSGNAFQFPYYDGSGYVEGYITLSSGVPTFNLRHNQNIWNIYLVVEYTKTTD